MIKNPFSLVRVRAMRIGRFMVQQSLSVLGDAMTHGRE
jgi:hypothetical protein